MSAGAAPLPERGPGPARRRHAADRGFSFLELLVVMGAMAVLMGLTVGYLGSIGSATQLDQARAILVETCRRCQTASIGGGRRAVVTLAPRETSEGATVLRVAASIAQPVVTYQFEGLDQVSGGLEGKAQGVTIERGRGYTGAAGLFGRGGAIQYGRQSSFAMTEGFELDVRVVPETGPQEMVLVEGLGDEGSAIYRVALVRGNTTSPDYDVEVRLRLRRPGEGARENSGTEAVFRSTGAPVRAGMGWQRVEVAWHGLEATGRVNGLDVDLGGKGRARRGGGLDDDLADEVRVMATPPSGVVAMSISSPGRSFVGRMDTFQLRGVFRNSEMQRDLPEALTLLAPSPPIRLVFQNGALDPEVHARGVLLRFSDTQKPDDPPLSVLVGMNGTVESRQEFVTGEARGAGPGDAP